MNTQTTNQPPINTHLQAAIDGILDACSDANLLGAALSHWSETHGDLSGSQNAAYGIRQRLLEVEEHLSQIRGLLNQ